MFSFVNSPATPPSSSWSKRAGTTIRPCLQRALLPTSRNLCHITVVPRPTRLRASADRSTEFDLTSSGSSSPGSSSSSSSSTPTPSPAAASTPASAWVRDDTPRTLAALPFPPMEVFLPGESKQLHLFEARYLALFEAVVTEHEGRCAHILIDTPRRAMAAVAALLFVREWRRLDVGVFVVVDAVGRLKTTKLLARQAPFITAEFDPVYDEEHTDRAEVEALRHLDARFWPAFRRLAALAVALDVDAVRPKVNFAEATITAMHRARNSKRNATLDGDEGDENAPPDARNNDAGDEMSGSPSTPSPQPLAHALKATLRSPERLEQHLKEAALRAVAYEPIDWRDDVGEIEDDEMVVRRAYALSFAGWDFFPSDAQQRQKAIEERSTRARLQEVVDALEMRVQELDVKRSIKKAFAS